VICSGDARGGAGHASGGAPRIHGGASRRRRGAGGFVLEPHGRYSHTEAYLRNVITEAGLQPAQISRCHLRVESKKPVEGLLVVARR